MAPTSITFDFDARALASEIFERQANLYFSSLPQPDPQFTCEQVAEQLGCDVSTVRAYLKLPPAHSRYLPHVQIADGPKGRRIRLSAITAWQERNDARTRTVALVASPAKRPARRRLAA